MVWEPFFLNHNTPPEGEDLMAHLMNKYGPAAVERYGKSGNPLDVAGLKVGIHFNPERRIIPTLDAHRVCEWVKRSNPEEADSFMERMFHAYFEAGKDLSKHDNLLAVVDECPKIDRAACATFLAGDELANETSVKGRSWSQRGVSGVPFFVVARKDAPPGEQPTAFSGAQPPEVIAELLEKLSEKY